VEEAAVRMSFGKSVDRMRKNLEIIKEICFLTKISNRSARYRVIQCGNWMGSKSFFSESRECSGAPA
jgi:hypothetical protein